MPKTVTQLEEPAKPAGRTEASPQARVEDILYRIKADAERLHQVRKGVCLINAGKYEEAETFIRRALELQIRAVGEQHPYTLVYRSDLGRTLFRLGRFAEAEQVFRTALEQGRADPRTLDWEVAWLRLWVGRCVSAQGRHEEAEAAVVDGYKALKAELGEEHRHTREALAAVVRLYETWGKADRAAEFRAALQALPENKK